MARSAAQTQETQLFFSPAWGGHVILRNPEQVSISTGAKEGYAFTTSQSHCEDQWI